MIAAMAMWAASLAMPVWLTHSEETAGWEKIGGLVLAMVGWLGVLVLSPGWFANPLALFLLIPPSRRWRGSFGLAVAAFLLACTAYATHAVYGDNDESVIIARLPGFYLWLGSFFVLMLAHAFASEGCTRPVARFRAGVVALLLVGVALLEVTTPLGVTRLQIACGESRDAAPLKAALALKPTQAQKDQALRWVVTYAEQDGCTSGRIERIELLVAAGANVNASDSQHEAPLLQASTGNHIDLLRLLIRLGADVNARDNAGHTALDRAVQMGTVECRRVLLEVGAKSATPATGPAASPDVQLASLGLIEAVHQGDRARAEALLKGGADPNVAPGADSSPLIIAAQDGQYEMVELLLQHGAKIDGAISMAAVAGDVQMMELLLAHGADPSVGASGFRLPLGMAIGGKHPLEAVRCLIAHGADVDAPGAFPPIIQAAELGDVRVVQLLLDHGAKVNATWTYGYTALAAAKKGGRADVVAALQRAGAR